MCKLATAQPSCLHDLPCGMTTAHIPMEVQNNLVPERMLAKLRHGLGSYIAFGARSSEIPRTVNFSSKDVTLGGTTHHDRDCCSSRPTSGILNTSKVCFSLLADRAPGSRIASIRSCIMIIPWSPCGDKIPSPSIKISNRVPRQPRVYMDCECITPQRLHPPLCNLCRQRVFCG